MGGMGGLGPSLGMEMGEFGPIWVEIGGSGDGNGVGGVERADLGVGKGNWDQFGVKLGDLGMEMGDLGQYGEKLRGLWGGDGGIGSKFGVKRGDLGGRNGVWGHLGGLK